MCFLTGCFRCGQRCFSGWHPENFGSESDCIISLCIKFCTGCCINEVIDNALVIVYIYIGHYIILLFPV